LTTIRYEYTQQTVQDFINREKHGSLNREPGFQRQSVWNDRDRRKLIDSIVRGYPLPAIFLHHRREDHVYDVIDGKQRLETILGFARALRGRSFEARLHLPGTDEPEWYDFRRLSRQKRDHLITGYKLQVIEVEGDLGDVIDLFVRINSTGKALTRQETRHAKYYKNSTFLLTASKISRAINARLRSHRVLTESQISRMKDVELMCEIMLSVHKGDVINKKAALDNVMKSADFSDRQIRAAESRTRSALTKLFRVFPHIASTRFTNISDFYSLAFLMAQLESEGAILTDRKRNAEAERLLIAFSNGVDELREKHRKFLPVPEAKSDYRDYYNTVREGTDAYDNRRKRHEILKALFTGLFERRDSDRLFSATQRRILWNTAAVKACGDCGDELSWLNFTVDHKRAWSKGGRTALKNAALLCQSCNSRKGNRSRRQRAA
jgi:5-methylcytosine-specific restriction endonuclease McrA